MAFDLGDYVDVASRLADLKAKFPDARVRVLDPDTPYRIETLDGQTFIVVVAACYRTADDPMPATGMAWEPYPGKTPYTRDSELQNAETSAWGRAIVAALASTSKSIASAEEVRNRQAEPVESPFVSAENAQALVDKCDALGVSVVEVVKLGTEGRTDDPSQVRVDEVRAVKAAIDRLSPAGDESTDGHVPESVAASAGESAT